MELRPPRQGVDLSFTAQGGTAQAETAAGAPQAHLDDSHPSVARQPASHEVLGQVVAFLNQWKLASRFDRVRRTPLPEAWARQVGLADVVDYTGIAPQVVFEFNHVADESIVIASPEPRTTTMSTDF